VSGSYRHGGWVNFDLVRHDYVTVIGDLVQLPFKDNSIDEIHCVHVLEHLTRDKHLPALLEMRRVLKPNAIAYIEVPDFKEVIDYLHKALLNNDEQAIHIWTTSVYGKTERKGMAHHFGFYEDKLISLCNKANFKKVVRSDKMISTHYKQEPVLLIRAEK